MFVTKDWKDWYWYRLKINIQYISIITFIYLSILYYIILYIYIYIEVFLVFYRSNRGIISVISQQLHSFGMLTVVDMEWNGQIQLCHLFHRLPLRVFLRFIDELYMIRDIGVGIRITLSARKNPGSNADLFAIADERTTTITLEM